MSVIDCMATPKPAEAKKKPKVNGGPRFPHRSFTPKKPSFAAPTQGPEHIIFDNMGTVKAASTFNLNIEAISKHIPNRLKYDGPLTALAVRELKAPAIDFPPDLKDPTNLVETTKWQRNFNHTYNQQKWWNENTQKIYPRDATFHTQDKNKAAHDRLVDKDERRPGQDCAPKDNP
jgi:hypothetical protein